MQREENVITLMYLKCHFYNMKSQNMFVICLYILIIRKNDEMFLNKKRQKISVISFYTHSQRFQPLEGNVFLRNVFNTSFYKNLVVKNLLRLNNLHYYLNKEQKKSLQINEKTFVWVGGSGTCGLPDFQSGRYNRSTQDLLQ